MKNILKTKKALSTVVTTLIILVVSVLLATVVTFYAINVTTTRVQEENLLVNKLHIWCNSSGGWSTAAYVIINTGGKDFVIDKIAVRGQESAWSDVYYWTTNTVTVSNDLAVNDTTLTDGCSLIVQGASRTFAQASSDLTLQSGYTMVVYIDSPDTISQSDIGVTVGMTLHTMNAQYYKECNVEAAE
jgi:hypothetical protein